MILKMLIVYLIKRFFRKRKNLAHANPKELYFKPDFKSAQILPDLNIIEEKLDLEDEFLLGWLQKIIFLVMQSLK